MAMEREKNLLGDLLATANGSNSAALLGKASFYLIFFLAHSISAFSILFALLKINFVGSFLLLMLFTVIFFIATIAICIFVSSFFKKKIIAIQVMAFSTYPLFFLSGYIWPIQSVPLVLQKVAYAIPLFPYIKAFLGITQMGASFDELMSSFIHLIILAVIGIIATYIRIRYLFKKEAVLKEEPDLNLADV